MHVVYIFDFFIPLLLSTSIYSLLYVGLFLFLPRVLIWINLAPIFLDCHFSIFWFSFLPCLHRSVDQCRSKKYSYHATIIIINLYPVIFTFINMKIYIARIYLRNHLMNHVKLYHRLAPGFLFFC